MPPKESLSANNTDNNVSPHNSSTPLITSAQRQDLQRAGAPSEAKIDEKDPKGGKRRFFGLGKKKEDTTKSVMDAPTVTAGGMPPPRIGAVGEAPSLNETVQPDLKAPPQPIPVSPSRMPHGVAAASPSRLRSSSPRMNSPASSEIFERNVQEPVAISNLGGERAELSPAHIPAHVMTEDSIPPALEASAQAITSDELNPDDVEIVTSAAHQPASTVLEGSSSHADLTQLNSPVQAPLHPLQHAKSEDSEAGFSMHQSGTIPALAEDDGASTYGQLDPNDVRRLSFISFKDIVQSEHQQQAASSLGEVGSRDSLHMSNLPPSILQQQENRAASPLRSPRSPASTHSQPLAGGVVTPPPGANTTNPLNAANAEQSPVRSIGLGSPGHQHGELTIETMRQALRKTASGDLSGSAGGRSAGMSPVSDENSVRETVRSRTNT